MPEKAPSGCIAFIFGGGGLVALLGILLGQGGIPGIIQLLKPPSSSEVSSTTKRYSKISDVQVPSGTFFYGGSTTFAPLREGADIFERLGKRDVATTIHNAHNGKCNFVHLNPINGNPGSEQGIRMLLNNQLTFAQSSRSIKEEEYDKAEKRGFKLKEIPVAYDGIAFYVQPELVNLGVKKITIKDVKDIYTGQKTNWKELGGPDLEIVPFSRDLKEGGTVNYLREEVLGDQELKAKIVKNTTASINQIARTPGGIGFATISEVINQQTIRVLHLAKDEDSAPVSPCSDDTCKTINKDSIIKQANKQYPLIRPLFVVIKNYDGSNAHEEAGRAYADMLLSDEGQKVGRASGVCTDSLKLESSHNKREFFGR